jgi:hypothetical protein
VKAPWYFAGIQELLLHFHPTIAVFVIPLLAGAWLLGFAYMKPGTRNPGIWFYSSKGLKITYLAALISFILTTGGILAGEYMIDFQAWLPRWPEIISNGIIPLLIWAVVLTGISFMVKRRLNAERTEMQLWIFTYLVVAYLVLMFTGILFRGPAMALVWNF